MPVSIAGTATSTTSASAGVRRSLDPRIGALLAHATAHAHRCVFVLVGDRSKDRIVQLHQLLNSASHRAHTNVLWCMKKDVEFGSTSRKRQERVARLEVKAGMSSELTKESFQAWLTQTTIRYCPYAETHKILGQTFGMLVLQDFEALTPNTLARTIETVSGGGAVVIVLRTKEALQQLHQTVMDAHARYRSASHPIVVPRFNARFVRSLAACPTALCVDDDWHVLPITSGMRDMCGTIAAASLPPEVVRSGTRTAVAELNEIRARLETTDVGPLVKLACTVDQAKCVLALSQPIFEKDLSATCVVTAPRGRGKSAAVGLAIAGAIAQGFSNIVCTAPAVENVHTLMEFAEKGLVAMGMKERTDFVVSRATSEELSHAVIRIDITKSHRQVIQYVAPTDAAVAAQAELLVVDEAAAIPLPMVKALLGSHLTILASTVSGYEGTGRSLSMKLVDDLRKRRSSGTGGGLREVSLQEPIRYGAGDPVESWLTSLLCLDATSVVERPTSTPHPRGCRLYAIRRDALFSSHPTAEALLRKVMALLVASHYKNEPNDLLLLADAPGHHIFALCSAVPVDGVPDVWAVVHVAEEGGLGAGEMEKWTSHGVRPSGDLIPHTLAHYFGPSIAADWDRRTGLRVVRIATLPEWQGRGYGGFAIDELTRVAAMAGPTDPPIDGAEEVLLVDVDEYRGRLPPTISYLSAAFGVTAPLLSFWTRHQFTAVYLRQTPQGVTGEHTGVVLRPFNDDARARVKIFRREFERRFRRLLAQCYRTLPQDATLALLTPLDVHDARALDAATTRTDGGTTVDGIAQCDAAEISRRFTDDDAERLRGCATAYADLSVVADLIPVVADLYFSWTMLKTPEGQAGVVLSHAQAATLAAVGLQGYTVAELPHLRTFDGVDGSQLRAFLTKALSRIALHLIGLQGGRVDEGADEMEVVRDESGAVVGGRVRRAPDNVSMDSTLLRDARHVSAGGLAELHEQLDRGGRKPRPVPRKRGRPGP